MDDSESSGTFEGAYKKLTCQEDFSTDENPLCPNQDKQQVSMSMVRPASSLNHHRLLVKSLAVLAVLLLAVDIGLGVHYSRLAARQHSLMTISSKVAKLQASYNAAVQRKEEAKKQLVADSRQHQLTKWELEHQNRIIQDYKERSDKIQTEIAVLKSHIPMIEAGCRFCSPRWILINSMCYYFPFSDTISNRGWQEARQYCKKQDADLAVIDSKEKQLAISELINNNMDPSRSITISGFWIGLRDVEEEGTWKWLDDMKLNEGYWNDGEPNDESNEDCAAVYPRGNPFKAWNDAPCTHRLKWICEITPRSSS